MQIAWPAALDRSSEKWSLNTGASRGGGRGLTNTEQVVALPSGYATASITVPCMRKPAVLAMRALLAALDGRAGTLLVGPYERPRAPWPTDPAVGGLITDRTPGAAQPAMSFALANDAAMNATQISIARARGGHLTPGMIFSIGSRLHMITGLTTPDPTDPASGVATSGNIGVLIRPWLRADYAAGTPIEFGTPVGTMRLASDDTGAMELQLSRHGTVTLDLVEAF